MITFASWTVLCIVIGICIAVYYLKAYNPHKNRMKLVAKSVACVSKVDFIPSTQKKSRQGHGKHTKIAASSRNAKKKRYRGQGK